MATPSETIIWTALPYARTATTLKLSAYVTFQLVGDSPVLNPTLFPTAANWDATQLKFAVYIQGAPTAIIPTTTSQSLIDPTLWKLLVPSQNPLPLISWDAHMQTVSGKTITTFNAAAIGSYLTQLQTNNVATAFGPAATLAQRAADPLILTASLPSVGESIIQEVRAAPAVKSKTAPLVTTGGRLGRIGTVAKKISAQRLTGTAPTTLENQLIEATGFFSPTEPVYPPIAPPVYPSIDFHQAMAMVALHPQLMRVLGVVVDLEIPIAGVPATGQIYLGVTKAALREAVERRNVNAPASATPAETPWQYPRTVYELGSDYFRPAPKPSTSDVVSGFLNMSPSLITIGNLDLAGGLLKTTAYATQIVEAAAQPVILSNLLQNLKITPVAGGSSAVLKPATSRSSSQPVTTNPPYNRTSGISVYKANLATSITSIRTQALKTVAALRSDTSGSGGDGPAGVGPFYADDLLKGWRPDFLHVGKQGSTWLSVNQRTSFYRIGPKVIGPFTDEAQLSLALTNTPTNTATQYLSEALFTWHGWSLAVPKPGEPLTDAGARTTLPAISNATDAQAYLNSYTFGYSKYPMATTAFNPPGILPLLRYGDSYSIRARYSDLAGNSLPVSASNPATGVTSQTTTYLRQEPIGPPALFPTKQKTGFGASAYTLVVRKFADGHIEKNPDLRQVVPALGDVSHAELHGMLDTPAGLPDPNQYALLQEFDSASPLPLFIPVSTTPHLPYLPDPASQGACLVPTSDVPLPVQLVNFYSGATWPHPNFGTMTLTAGTAASTTGSTGTNFAVTLAPGQSVNFNLSSSTSANFLPDFQQTWALETALQAANKSVLPILSATSPKVAVKAKSLAKHTPFNMTPGKVTVAQLTPPQQIKGVDTGPSPEQIYVQSFISGRNQALSPPTQVTTIYATQIPEPGLAAGRNEATRDPNSTKGNFRVLPTVHGWSTEEVEYFFTFNDQVDDLAESQRTTTNVTRTNRAFSLPVPYVDEQPIYMLSGLPTQYYEFNDTKTHTVNLQLVAKTRYLSCFPSSWYNDPKHPFTVSLNATQPVIVPSSRRPDSVAIEAVLPVFQWVREAVGNTSFSGRKGNTIRVYLRRPWFSSGNDEQLAVILGTDLATEGDLPPFVTLIGTDPAFKNPVINKFLTVDNFPNRDGSATTGNAVPAIKESAQPVVAALYNPVFDTFHQMWVVDIDIDPPTSNAYTPFIRLALARYQAKSITGMNVSSIAITDITQLHAHRVAVLQVVQTNKVVSVSLYATAAAESYVGKNVAVGTLEEKVGSDPDTGWTPALDAKGYVVENVVALNEGNVITPVQYQPVDLSSVNISTSTLAKRKFVPVTINKSAAAASPIAATSTVGVFDLPDSSQTYRIVVREYELHVSGSAEPAVMGAPAAPEKGQHVVGRLVHVDALSVPGVRG